MNLNHKMESCFDFLSTKNDLLIKLGTRECWRGISNKFPFHPLVLDPRVKRQKSYDYRVKLFTIKYLN